MEWLLRAFVEKPGSVGAGVALGFIALAYLFTWLDRFRSSSPSKEDTQVGLKIVLWALILAGLFLASRGVTGVVYIIFSGFETGSGTAIKMMMPSIIVGGGAIAAIAFVFLPRTNQATFRQPERYALGLVSAIYGALTISNLSDVLTGLFMSAKWGETAPAIASLLVDGAIAILAISRFGSASGWTAPVRAQPPMPGGQGGGYGQPPGGYGQQGGGYPPQGGGYPPQGGGYPPQGGGYPPPA